MGKVAWMMNVIKCENGHYFDSDRYDRCPICNATNNKQITSQGLRFQDTVSFADSEKAFCCRKSEQQIQMEKDEKAITVLEKAIKKYAESNFKDKIAHELIVSSLINAPLLFPVEIDLKAMFGSMDPTKLKEGDVIRNEQDVRMRILTLTLDDGTEIIPAFTSDEEANKGPKSSIIRYYPINYLPVISSMNKIVVINAFGNCKYAFGKYLIDEVLTPIVRNDFNKRADNVGYIPAENNEDELIGTLIDNKYQVLKEIGRGSLSRIYLCAEKRFNKIWTAKVIDKKQKQYNGVLYDSIMQETRMVMHLDHQGIQRIVDFIETDRYLFIIREYVEGEPISAIFEQYGPQPVDKVIDWAKQVCEILQYLHTINPPHIHRDIKPMNLILMPNGKVKLIDFGIMRTYKVGAKGDTCCLGTRGYAAPEQFGNMGQTDARTDIYGLGMTMFNLVTGIKVNDLTFQIKPIRQINPALPKRLEEIISRCINSDPAKRYKSAEDLLYALNNAKDKDAPKGLFGNLFNKKTF